MAKKRWNIFSERPAHWLAEPTSVACPYCNRPTGAVCKSPKGRGLFGRPHKSRVTLARGKKKQP